MVRRLVPWVLVACALASAGAVWLGRSAWRSGAVHRVAADARHALRGREVTPSAAGAIEVSAARLARGRADLRHALEWSATRHDYAVVVDKSAYTLHVYKDGHRVASWPVELGPDPVGDKQQEGDLRTPEGRYSVTWRREPGETRFYRALLLDYPNAADRAAGRTGSHIEIHGMGSGSRPGHGGTNWTLGCVALANEHVDELFALADGAKHVRAGTPVVIVYAGTLPDERYRVTD